MNKAIRVLFLDIDGVLCLGNPWRYLDLRCVEALYSIVRAVPELVLVLSSDWRKEESLEDQLAHVLITYGIPPPEHKTPALKQSDIDWSRYTGMNAGVRGALRSEEIREWLSQYPVEKFAAVDDTPLYLDSGYFQTDRHVGLTSEIAQEIINHLNKEYEGENEQEN